MKLEPAESTIALVYKINVLDREVLDEVFEKLRVPSLFFIPFCCIYSWGKRLLAMLQLNDFSARPFTMLTFKHY